MPNKIVRIHPEVKEIRTPSSSLVESYLARMQFINPYASRDEYRFREQRFLREQAELFSPIGLTPDKVKEMQHDLTGVITGIFFFSGPKQMFDLTLGDRVFGEEVWKRKSDVRLYKGNDQEVEKELELEEAIFRLGRVFFMNGIIKDEEQGMDAAYSLNRNSLTPHEIQESAQRAFDLYNIFEFSNLHYKKSLRHNPFKYFLNQIVSVLCKLDPAKMPDSYHEGEAIGFSKGEDTAYPGLSVPNPVEESCPLILINCQERFHKDVVKAGDKVRYLIDGESHYGSYTGTLLDVLQE